MIDLDGILGLLQRRLDSRFVLLAAVLAGILLSLPSLGSGLSLDDFPQRIAMLTRPGSNVFDFIRPGSAANEAWWQSGILPWWEHPATRIDFFRPLAQWSMELDYRFWPDNFPLMHLHSVLWYGLLVMVAGIAYRRFATARWVAGLAIVLFAVDAPHRGAIAWLASRNAILGMVAALLCLLCYRQRGFSWQVPGWALLALAMGCSEGALAITAYLFAYEVCLSDLSWGRRLLRLLPYALVALAWLMFWKRSGHGVAYTGFYVDPVADPGAFVAALVYRFPAYLIGQFLVLLPPTEIFSRFEDSSVGLLVMAYAWTLVAVITWLLIPVLRASRQARFFGLGLLIATIPICGSVLYSRDLWYVGFGSAGLLALAVGHYRESMNAGRARRGDRIFVAAMIVLHLLISPLLFLAYGVRAEMLLARLDSDYVQLPDQGGTGRQVLVVSTPNYGATISFPLLKDEALSLGSAPQRQPPAIKRVRALAEGEGEFDLLREGPDMLEVSAPGGLTTLRPPQYGFARGDRVNLDDVEIEIEAVTAQGAPTRIRYRFAPGALAGYQVLAWAGRHFESGSLPDVGQALHVSGHDARGRAG